MDVLTNERIKKLEDRIADLEELGRVLTTALEQSNKAMAIYGQSIEKLGEVVALMIDAR